jgi:hypothetical protein
MAGYISKRPAVRVDFAKDLKLRCVTPATATLNAQNSIPNFASTAYHVHNDLNNDVA